MEPISVTASDLLDILSAIAVPAVITKNKHTDSEQNFRPAPDMPGRWLDGFWTGKPAGVTPGAGFGIHFVERDRLVWIGEYRGTELDERSGRNSLILDHVQSFEVQDLSDTGISPERLRTILKQPGAVTYSYYYPASGRPPLTGPCYTTAEVKVRLQQKAFRQAVFALHGARCLITGCEVEELVDAAHLPGRDWKAGHNAAHDGIPLRADLHRALDAQLIRLDDEHRLTYLHPGLEAAYGQYLQR